MNEENRNQDIEPVEETESILTEETSTDVMPQEPSKRSGGGIWMAVSIILVILLGASLVYPPFGGTEDEAVATVNGIKITKTQLYNKLVEVGGENTLESLISDEAVRQAIEESGVVVPEEEIEQELDMIRSYYTSNEEFEAELVAYNYTLDKLKVEIGRKLMIQKIVEPNVTITDEDVSEYFQTVRTYYDVPEQVKASHILVESKAEADSLLAQIQGGASFEELAAANSLDTFSKENGGDLDYFERGIMDEGFESVAFALQIGELAVAQSSHGYHVVKKTGHNPAETADLKEHEEEIRELLKEQEMMRLSEEWVAEVKNKAVIVNRLEKTVTTES